MSTSMMLRNRYVTDSVETMSPGRMVVALYDRLVLDLQRAGHSIATEDLSGAHTALVHAQDIVAELHGALDPSRWAPANQLASLYEFVLDELVAANVNKDARRVESCLHIVEPLRDAWHQAAGVSTPDQATRTA